MAQRTDTELAPNAAAEDSAASPPLPSQAPDLFRDRPNTRLLAVGAILVLLVAGFFAWRYFSTYESTDDAEVDGHMMPVSARISGYVTTVNVTDNQMVQPGTVLAEIDPRDYQLAVNQARAALATAEANAKVLNFSIPLTTVTTSSSLSSSQADVENAQAGISAAQQQYEAAQAHLNEAQANDLRARNDLVRYKQLVAKQEISQQRYDQAVAAAASSAAAVSAAQASSAAAAQEVTQARSRLAGPALAGWPTSQTAPQQIASVRARALSADAEVKQRQAQLEQAELNLQYTKIVAPTAGVVMKSVEVGMNVQPGQQLLMLVPLNDVWITANFKETQLKYMRVGQRVDIQVDANGRTYHGHIDSIAGSSGARMSLLPPENATGNYVKVVQRIPVKIVLDPGQNNDLYLRPGMSVVPKVFLK